MKAIRGEREREGVRGEPGMKEGAGSCRHREAGEIRGKKKGDEEHRPKHEENNREGSSHTHRAVMKTNEEDTKCERGDELSCGSSSAFPLWVFSLVSLRVSAESYGMSSSPAWDTSAGSVQNLQRCTASLLLCFFVEDIKSRLGQISSWRFFFFNTVARKYETFPHKVA